MIISSTTKPKLTDEVKVGKDDGDVCTLHNPFQASMQERRSTVKSLQSLTQILRRRKDSLTLQQGITGTSGTISASSSFEMTVSHNVYDKLYESDSKSNACINSAKKRSTSRSVTIRSLKSTEIETLVSLCACQCDDWNNIYVMMYCTDYNSAMSMGYESDKDGGQVNKYANLSPQLKEQVQNCSFEGCVILGIDLECSTHTTKPSVPDHNPTTSVETSLKPAIKNNTLIKNATIAPGAKVYNNTFISDTFIGPQSSIINCGAICNESASRNMDKNNKLPCFVDEIEIALGPESGGGRPINVRPESTLVDACTSLGISQPNTIYQGYQGRVMNMKPTPIEINIILGHVKYTQRATNIYISESATIESCSSVVNTILLPQSKLTNSTIESAFLQWKSSITDSNVSSTILMECSDIGPKSVVADTVIGPDSHVSCGEVHCSLIGPNTNSHHQSLVISALWPMGRGNVGYGSNIGSNHTGRLPDQECAVGEGIFWGLGCIIKYPVDLSRSYYSIVAAGVQLPPSTISMPFSLIMNGSSIDSDGSNRNEIVPGWLLQSSPYTVLRSEEKFKKRRKAKRHGFYCDWRIIRPSVVDACVDARESLRKLEILDIAPTGQQSSVSDNGKDSRRLYTKRNLVGLGENYMTDRGKRVGIQAYTSMIQRYALKGLYDKMSAMLKIGNISQAVQEISILLLSNNNFDQGITNNTSTKVSTTEKSWPVMPWVEKSYGNAQEVLKHQMNILSCELQNLIGPKDLPLDTNAKVITILLKKMISLEQNHLVRVRKSKMRDDTRGSQIIPGYKGAHDLASDDAVVRMAETTTRDLVTKCKEFITSLESYEATTLKAPQSKL